MTAPRGAERHLRRSVRPEAFSVTPATSANDAIVARKKKKFPPRWSQIPVIDSFSRPGLFSFNDKWARRVWRLKMEKPGDILFPFISITKITNDRWPFYVSTLHRSNASLGIFSRGGKLSGRGFTCVGDFRDFSSRTRSMTKLRDSSYYVEFISSRGWWLSR